MIRYDPAKIEPAWWDALLVGPEDKARWVVDQLRNQAPERAAAL